MDRHVVLIVTMAGMRLSGVLSLAALLVVDQVSIATAFVRRGWLVRTAPSARTVFDGAVYAG